MRYYVLWGEVQDRLEQWHREHGTATDFAHALSLLWDEGRAHEGECLPKVDFASWNLEKIEEFHTLMQNLPVDISFFLEAEEGFSEPSDSMREAMNVLPIKIAAYQEESLHTHNNYEFLYVLKGKGYVKTQNGTMVCPEGTLCLIAPDFTHDVLAGPRSEVISLAFWRESVENILQKLLKKENIMTEFFRNSLNRDGAGYVLLNLPPKIRVYGIVQNIFQEGYSKAEYAKELCSSYIELLFSYALRACADLPETHIQEGKKPRIPMAAVMKYIQDHYRTTSLAEVAAAFHYEPDYLSRQIKGCMGKGYVDLVLQLKLEEAKRLLHGTQLTMDQIAEQTGFGSAVHFSRMFRKKTGFSPSEYRSR